MIISYAFYPGDQELAAKNASWIAELGGCKGHECLLIPDVRCSNAKFVLDELKRSFDSVHVVQEAKAQIDGWPQGANYFFRIATSHFGNWFAPQSPRLRWPYFLWMEPDAIPLREGWLDAIDNEFQRAAAAGKRFMGDRVEVRIEGKEVPLHMSGIGIYPNPLHAFAGEAYRAFEEAWDMAGRDQIVPQAHWTKLIEHAWKHPSFKDEHELFTQIRPESVLFHSSKDGSLIDLLRQKKSGIGETIRQHLTAVPVLADSRKSVATGEGQRSVKPDLNGEARESTDTESRETRSCVISSADSRGGSQTIPCDIFIRTYPGDYPWLAYCVLSIHKFCTGFRKITVVSPGPQPDTVKGVEWKVMQDETEDGYLAQQITKLYADVTADYQPDYILHLDSDTIFTQPVTPDYFLWGYKPIWYYTPYSELQRGLAEIKRANPAAADWQCADIWKPITEKFMGFPVENEFMRRFPMIVPRWLYPKLREFCYNHHGMIISQYIRNQPHRSFSEFNVLGAYAYQYHRGMFHFVNTLEVEMPDPVAKQYHSWGRITPEIKAEIETILGGTMTSDSTRCQSMSDAASDGATQNIPRGNDFIPVGIKELPSGIWVLENDTHVSKWVEQEGRLDHDQNTLPFILPHIKEGDTVIDVGAFIGDHTIAYARKVGGNGMVYAFEPNSLAYECLAHNMEECLNVRTFKCGLGTRHEMASLVSDNGNAAGNYLETLKTADSVGVIDVYSLDSLSISCRHVHLIKLDCEGYEVEALQGARALIERSRPILIVEVNKLALQRQGYFPKDLWKLLDKLDYDTAVMQENCDYGSPMYDLICLPRTLSPVGRRESTTVKMDDSTDSNDRIVAPLAATVRTLKEHADKGKVERKYVLKLLSDAGLAVRRNKVRKK